MRTKECICGCSAVGSASPCQGEGREFESRHPLQYYFGYCLARLAQRESASLTRKRSLVQSQYRAPRVVVFGSVNLGDHADVAQLVAHHLAKVRVASSSLVIRSGCRVPTPNRRCAPWWNGRVVRQRSAKPCTRVRFPFPPLN